MGEQERREDYYAQRREDERYCKHGMEVCEPCAYDRGVADEHQRCIRAVCDNCRNIPPYMDAATPVYLHGRWVHRLIGRDYECGANAIRLSSDSRKEN